MFENGPRWGSRALARALLLLGFSLIGACSKGNDARSSLGAGGGLSNFGRGGAGNASGGVSSAGEAGDAAAGGDGCEADRRCSAEGVLEVCHAGVFEPEEDCKDVARCSATRHSCLRCAPGTFACLDSGKLEQCSLDGSTWEIVRDCGSGSACVANADVGYCELCEPAAMLCEATDRVYPSSDWSGIARSPAPTELRSCNALGSGTELVEHCSAAAPICDASAGSCRACVPNHNVCNGKTLLRCDAAGAKLSVTEECASAALCDAANGVCKKPGCRTSSGKNADVGDVVCEKTTLSICRAGGAWDVLDICETEDACSDGVLSRECLDAAAGHCVPGDTQCDGNSLKRCAAFADDALSSLAGGSWYVYAECRGECVESSTGVADCAAAGLDSPYAQATPCEPGAASYLACAAGACQSASCDSGKICAGSLLGCAVCVPDAVRCDGSLLKRCDALGQTEAIEQDCTGAVCDKLRARCLPARVGERYCDAGKLFSVVADGSSQLVADCGSAALCDGAAGCSQPVCVPGSVACGGAAGSQVEACTDGTQFRASGKTCESAARCEDGLGCAIPLRVTAGDAHTCVLLGSEASQGDSSATGFVKCWGANESGQLGNGSTLLGDEPVARPVLSVLGGGTPLAAPIFRQTGLCAGKNFSCADVTLPSGVPGVACWGANDRAQLGGAAGAGGAVKGNANQLPPAGANNLVAFSVARAADSAVSPTAMPFAGLHAVTCGADFACALDDTDHAFCWGANDFGQLGTDQGSITGAVPVSGLGKLTALVAGARNACAIDAHSQVYCWGDNSKGVLGQGLSTTDLASSSSPLRLAGLRADALALGRDFALALDASESGVPALLAWGQNTFGALGTFDFTPSLVPINAAAVVLDAGLRIVSGPLAEHVCAPQGATLACWGANPLGELGDGTRTDRARPTPTLGGILPVDADGKLALGKAHTCAIDAQGALWCWGANQRHQLGAAVTDSVSPSPVRVY